MAEPDPVEAAARRGDVDKIIAALAGDSLHRIDHREALQQIDAAIAVQTAEGDDALISATYELMISFTSRLIARLHVLAAPKLGAFDTALENRATATNTLATLNREILPAIEALHGHAVKLCGSYASTKRALRQADKASPPPVTEQPPIRIFGDVEDAPARTADVA